PTRRSSDLWAGASSRSTARANTYSPPATRGTAFSTHGRNMVGARVVAGRLVSRRPGRSADQSLLDRPRGTARLPGRCLLRNDGSHRLRLQPDESQPTVVVGLGMRF